MDHREETLELIERWRGINRPNNNLESSGNETISSAKKQARLKFKNRDEVVVTPQHEQETKMPLAQRPNTTHSKTGWLTPHD